MSEAPQMPFSPLDALINALPDVRKAGRVKPGDNVLTVQKRIAAVFLPIVKRIQREAIASTFQDVCENCSEAIHAGPVQWYHDYTFNVFCDTTKTSSIDKTAKPKSAQ